MAVATQSTRPKSKAGARGGTNAAGKAAGGSSNDADAGAPAKVSGAQMAAAKKIFGRLLKDGHVNESVGEWADLELDYRRQLASYVPAAG
jgi:hypothetical protein